MPDSTESLMEKIRALPPERIAEVEDFVELILNKARRQAAMDRLLAIAPAIEAANAPPITESDIEAEITAVRAERRMGIRGANRS